MIYFHAISQNYTNTYFGFYNQKFHSYDRKMSLSKCPITIFLYYLLYDDEWRLLSSLNQKAPKMKK